MNNATLLNTVTVTCGNFFGTLQQLVEPSCIQAALASCANSH